MELAMVANAQLSWHESQRVEFSPALVEGSRTDTPTATPVAGARRRTNSESPTVVEATGTVRSSRSVDGQDRILNNVALVEFVARRVGTTLPPSLSRQDLLGYGTIGLIEAVDRFDESVGVKFETFAIRRIWGAMMDALRKQGLLPRNVARRIREMHEATAGLEQELSVRPSLDDVARRLGVETSELEETVCASRIGLVSLEAELGDSDQGDSVTLRDILAADSAEPGEQVAADEQLALLVQRTERLPERERLVLTLYYHEELTLRHIGQVLGISESRVCQLHTSALNRLRGAMVEGRSASNIHGPGTVLVRQVSR